MKKTIPNPRRNEAAHTLLAGIVKGNKMEGQGVSREEVIVCSPIEVKEGMGSLFQTAYLDSEGRIFAHTFYGRSDHLTGHWVFAAHDIFEITPENEFYKKYRELLVGGIV